MNRALVLLALITAYPVYGGSAAKADDPRAMQLTYGPWTRLCFKRADGNSDCFISSAARRVPSFRRWRLDLHSG